MLRRHVFCVLLLITVTAGLFAHPHTAFSVKLEFEFDGIDCIGFWQEWTFDPFFSAEIVNGFDSNGNRRFEAAEIQNIYNRAFINLRNYGFWTILRQGSRRSSPDAVEQFSASLRNNRVVYRFFVRLAGKGLGNDFHVAIFDTTYYCAISYEDVAATIAQKRADGPEFVWQKEVNRNFPIHYNPAGAANDNTVYEVWRPGLITAYPEEIHVRPAGSQ